MSKTKNKQVGITPAKARKIALDKIPEIKTGWLNRAKESIRWAAECGDMFTEFYCKNDEERTYVSKELKKLGFRTKNIAKRVGHLLHKYLVVSWS